MVRISGHRHGGEYCSECGQWVEPDEDESRYLEAVDDLVCAAMDAGYDWHDVRDDLGRSWDDEESRRRPAMDPESVRLFWVRGAGAVPS